MSNILYRMQIKPQDETETCIIDSNDVLLEKIEEHQKLQLERAGGKQRSLEDGEEFSGDGGEECYEDDFTGLEDMVPQEAAQVGYSYADLCEKIVMDSLAARKAERR